MKIKRKKKKRIKIRFFRYFCFLALLSTGICAVNCLYRESVFSNPKGTLRINGNFHGDSYDDTIQSDENPNDMDKFISSLGFSETFLPFSKLSQGPLVLIDKNHRTVSVRKEDTVNLIDYTNSFYTINNYSMRMRQDAASALGEMMFGYSSYSGENNLVVYDTASFLAQNPSSCPCPEYFPENNLGTCVDIAVKQGDDIVAFSNAGAERWLFDNCISYGYILRYPDGKEDKTGHKPCPWHFRYVGKVHSKIMYDKNLCLEEYLDYMRNYSEENPLFYNVGGSDYAVYSRKCLGENTPVNVPIDGNCDISGDNYEKFIITIKLN
ncbi:MAG: D-alanyl-D-alanine carboxypeptidase family protein [Ruminococcus sp.]|nr:D-alanyl-D-alanine carboxypeptidase family protein [Ruminococcus sp.]